MGIAITAVAGAETPASVSGNSPILHNLLQNKSLQTVSLPWRGGNSICFATKRIELAANQIGLVTNQIELTANPIGLATNQIELTANPIGLAANQIELIANPIELVSTQRTQP